MRFGEQLNERFVGMTKIEDFGMTVMRRMPWWIKAPINFGTTANPRKHRSVHRECGNKNAAFHPF